MKYELTTTPLKEEAKAISQGIIDYNKNTVGLGLDDEIKFSVFVKDEDDNVQGGLRAVCYWNTLHIELLWLDEICRGKGIGEKILKQAENFALENGYEKALVETTSWQAKPFYEKNGYQLQYTLKDRPKGYESYYFSKIL